MSPPPVWLLDIDGVINGSPREAGWGGPPSKVKAGFPVYYEPRLIDRIRAVHMSGRAEVRWCTTWCGWPDQLKHLGALLDLDLSSAFGDRPASKTWADLKVEAALDVLREGRRLIWTDDSEVSAACDLFPLLARAEFEGRALLIEPVSERGLRPEHLDSIEAFTQVGQLKEIR